MMTTEAAKELLLKLGIAEFDVFEYESVCSKLRKSQLESYDKRDYETGEKLCELERFLDSNGGNIEPLQFEDGYFHSIIKY